MDRETCQPKEMGKHPQQPYDFFYQMCENSINKPTNQRPIKINKTGRQEARGRGGDCNAPYGLARIRTQNADIAVHCTYPCEKHKLQTQEMLQQL